MHPPWRVSHASPGARLCRHHPNVEQSRLLTRPLTPSFQPPLARPGPRVVLPFLPHEGDRVAASWPWLLPQDGGLWRALLRESQRPFFPRAEPSPGSAPVTACKSLLGTRWLFPGWGAMRKEAASTSVRSCVRYFLLEKCPAWTVGSAAGQSLPCFRRVHPLPGPVQRRPFTIGLLLFAVLQSVHRYPGKLKLFCSLLFVF